jgi:hypothetical protein
MTNILEPDFGSRAFRYDKRETYLEALRQGMGRKQAARSIGVGIRTVQRYANQHPRWVEDRDEAEAEAIEQVENALFNTAINGNVSASIFFLTNRHPDRWTDKRRPNINLTAQAAAISGDAEQQGVIARIMARVDDYLEVTEGKETNVGQYDHIVRELGNGSGDQTHEELGPDHVPVGGQRPPEEG